MDANRRRGQFSCCASSRAASSSYRAGAVATVRGNSFANAGVEPVDDFARSAHRSSERLCCRRAGEGCAHVARSAKGARGRSRGAPDRSTSPARPSGGREWRSHDRPTPALTPTVSAANHDAVDQPAPPRAPSPRSGVSLGVWRRLSPTLCVSNEVGPSTTAACSWKLGTSGLSDSTGPSSSSSRTSQPPSGWPYPHHITTWAGSGRIRSWR